MAAAIAAEMAMPVVRPTATRTSRAMGMSAIRPDGEWATRTQCNANNQHATSSGIAAMGARNAAASAGKGAERLATQNRLRGEQVAFRCVAVAVIRYLGLSGAAQ